MAKLSGLLQSVLSDPGLRTVVDAAREVRAAEVPALRVEGPAALRPFLAAGFGADRTVLAVTATDREAEDLGTATADLIGPDAVAVLPSWETLPHERLSPRPDTVGRRLSIFRRLADPATAPNHYARFAFCKNEALLAEALGRVRGWIEARRGRRRHVLTAAAG